MPDYLNKEMFELATMPEIDKDYAGSYDSGHYVVLLHVGNGLGG